MSAVHIAVDVPNVLCGMHETARREIPGWEKGRPLCLDVPHFHQLCHALCAVESAAWAATDRPNLGPIFTRARGLRPQVELLLHELGVSGCEVGIDVLLQNHILLKLLPQDPGVLVLATGDGNGWTEGRGFLPTVRLLVERGWRIELMAWSCCANRYLRTFAEEHGVFVALEDFFESITFEPSGVRRSELVPLEERPAAIPTAASGAFAHHRLSSASILNPVTGR